MKAIKTVKIELGAETGERRLMVGAGAGGAAAQQPMNAGEMALEEALVVEEGVPLFARTGRRGQGALREGT